MNAKSPCISRVQHKLHHSSGTIQGLKMKQEYVIDLL